MASVNEGEETIVKTLGLNWSQNSYQLDEFLKQYPLPQLVKIEAGIYEDTEEETLTQGQTLILHTIAKKEVYHGKIFNQGREVIMPGHCRDKVEVRPQNVSLDYDSVQELSTVFPGSITHVRVTKDHFDIQGPSRSIRAGMKLQLDYVRKDDPEKPLLMCLDENGCEVALAMDVRGGFQPLAENGGEYFLSEVVEKFKLPVYIQFTTMNNPIDNGGPRQSISHRRRLTRPTMLQLIKMEYKKTIIASTNLNGVKTVLTFPCDLDVSLVVPTKINDSDFIRKILGALNNEIDLGKTIGLTACHPTNQEVKRLDFNSAAAQTVTQEDEHIYVDIDKDQQVRIRSKTQFSVNQRNGTCWSACFLVRFRRRRKNKDNTSGKRPPAPPPKDYPGSQRYHATEHQRIPNTSLQHTPIPQRIPNNSLQHTPIPQRIPNTSSQHAHVPQGGFDNEAFRPEIAEQLDYVHVSNERRDTSTYEDMRENQLGYVHVSNERRDTSTYEDMREDQEEYTVPEIASRKKNAAYEDMGGNQTNEATGYQELVGAKTNVHQSSGDTRVTQENMNNNPGTNNNNNEAQINVGDMSQEGVAEFLVSLELGQYSSNFQHAQVDGELLMSLDKKMLKRDFGMNDWEAFKLTKAVQGWRPKM